MSDKPVTIWFTTASGRTIRHDDAFIEDDGKTATLYANGAGRTKTHFKEFWSTDKHDSMELRAEQLINQIAEWSAAIGRSEVVLNRISKAQHRIDVESESGFTEGQKLTDLNEALTILSKHGNPEREKHITEQALKDCGFKYSLLDDTPYETWEKHGIVVWNFNDSYWLVDMLDQAGIDRQFCHMRELALFFSGCGKDMYAT